MNEKRPQYLQIYDYIIERIENEEYAEQSQLPTISESAKQWNVSKQTISHTYRLLKKDGYIENFRGKYFVTG